MPKFKCSLIFTSLNGKVGWSETFYLEESSTTAAVFHTNSLAFGRKGFLCGANIVGFRVVDADVRGAKATTGSLTGFGPGIPGAVNDYNNGVLVNCVPTLGVTRRMFLRGLSDTMVSAGVFTPTPTWSGAFNFWRAAAQPAMLVRHKVLPVPIQVFSISASGLVASGDPGLFDTGLVTFHGCRDSSGRLVTGTFRGRLADATTTANIQLSGWLVGRTAGPGQWFDTTLQYLPMTTISEPKLAERKFGRPFDLPRGLKRLVGRGLSRTG